MESTGIMGNLNKKNPGKNNGIYYVFSVGSKWVQQNKELQ